jgi:tetratricopeptide (TPR) repeat protein
MVGQAVMALAMLLGLTAFGAVQPANSEEPPSIVAPLGARSFEDFEKAAEAARLQYGDDDVRYAEVLLSAGWLTPVYWPRASIEGAVKKALAIVERADGPNSLSVARCLLALARHYMVPGPWNPDREREAPKARQSIERALTIYEANGMAESDQAARAIEQLGLLEKQAGNATAAEAHVSRALSIIEKTAGPDHQRVVGVLHELIVLYRMQKRFADIEPIYKRITSIEEASFGQGDWRTLVAWDGLADYYRSRCRDVEAEAIERRTSPYKARNLSAYIAEMERAPDAKHPMLAQNLKQLGDYHRQMAQWADAERAYKRAVAALEKDGSHWELWQARAGLAESYLRQARVDEAESEYLRAVDAFRSYDPADRNKVLPLEVLDGLSAVYERTARQEEAAALKAQAAAGRHGLHAARKCL